VDAMLRRVQTDVKEGSVMRSHSLRVRMGMVTDMAKVIEYYIPAGFRTKTKWIPSEQRGKILQFPVPEKMMLAPNPLLAYTVVYTKLEFLVM
jgi:hypothetical protein